MRTDPWPRDPRLAGYRDAVWELAHAGRVRGHLLCRVVPFRAPLQFWVRAEALWYQACWADGHRDRPQLDTDEAVVADLEQGRFRAEGLAERVLDARPLTGAERDAAWRRLHG